MKRVYPCLLSLSLSLFMLLLLFIPAVHGYTDIPNANDTSDHIYENSSFIDTEYVLNPTDSVFYVQLWRTINKYPYEIVYSVNDTKNNKLEIFTAYNMISDGFITDTIGVTISAQINGKPVLMKTSFEKDSYQYNMNFTVMPIPFFDQKYENDIWLSGSLISFFDGGKVKTFDMQLNKNYYFNTLFLPSSSDYFTFNSIGIKYRDNGISSVKYDIDNAYNALNPVFRFLFYVFRALIAIVNGLTFGTLISNTDSLAYQSYIITPLSFLNTLIDYIFGMIRFILVMGFLWCMVIISLILFIYSYATSNDILETFSNFANNEYQFISIVIIRPVLWVYDKLILGIIGIIRG